MIFEVFDPSAAGAQKYNQILPWIETLFCYREFMPDHSIERVVPTGHIFLIFELDGILRHSYDNETLEPNGDFSGVWLSGIQSNAISISAHQNSSMFVIQFKPYGAFPFLGLAAQETLDRIVPAQDLFGEGILELQSNLVTETDTAKRFSLALEWLLGRYDSSLSPPPELIEFIDAFTHNAHTALQDLCETYSTSQKNLIDQFKKFVGLTPKYYQRMLRFNELLRKIQHQQQIDWSSVAYDCGYTDQSHFIREFRHFSGFNPRKFVEDEQNIEAVNFFAMDREHQT